MAFHPPPHSPPGHRQSERRVPNLPFSATFSANVAAYAGTKGGELKLAVINKGAANVQLELPQRFRLGEVAHRWELGGDSLSAKRGSALRKGALTPPAGGEESSQRLLGRDSSGDGEDELISVASISAVGVGCAVLRCRGRSFPHLRGVETTRGGVRPLLAVERAGR